MIQYVGYQDGTVIIGDVESLLQQFRAKAARIDSNGTLELLIESEEEEGYLVWQDIQEIAQIKTQ